MFELPDIAIDLLPPEEREAAQFVEGNLRQLKSSWDEFRASLELYHHVGSLTESTIASVPAGGADEQFWNNMQAERDRSAMRSKWEVFACRAGATALYGFQMSTQAMYKNFGDCPSLRAKVDETALKSATRLFQSAFPRIAAVRNSALHPGELKSTAAEFALNSISGDIETDMIVHKNSGPSFLGDTIEDDGDKVVYSVTFRGALHSYELSQASVEMLGTCATKYWAAFYPAEDPALAEWRARIRQNDWRRG